MKYLKQSFIIFSFLTLLSYPVRAQSNDASSLENATPETQTIALSASGLPLPRFASLQSDQVNLRTGPGTRYPIDWVYVRADLPLEITAEYDIWRRVRDWEGSEGWVHKAALSGKRTCIVLTNGSAILGSDKDGAVALATVQAGAIGTIESCASDWCEVNFKDIKGYMPKKDFWGAYAQEIFD